MNDGVIDEKIMHMKNIFRILVLLLLIILVILVLVKNRKSVQFEADQAKTVIDSIPVRIVHLKPDSARYILETAGKVKSTDEVYVVSQTPGEIKQVFVKIGEVVKKGESLYKSMTSMPGRNLKWRERR